MNALEKKSLANRLRRAGRHHRRRDPAIAGPPVPAPAVRPHPHDHQPVQLLRDMIAQQRERHPALRAAVPAPGKVPDHLEPRQMRVIPPPRPAPQGRACHPCRRPRPAPCHRRRHHHRPKAPASPAPTTSRTPSAAKPPGQRAAAPAQPPAPCSPPEAGRSPRAAHPPAAPAHGSPPAPQPAHPRATPQHPPNPGQRQPQPPRGTANTLTSRTSRTTPSVSHDSPPTPATRLPNTYTEAGLTGKMIRRGIRFHANFLPQPLTFLTVDYREILDRLERREVPVNRNIAPLGPLGQAVAGHRGFRIWLSVAGSFLLLVLATEIVTGQVSGRLPSVIMPGRASMAGLR
jgi:hypothetical protein